jgi:hypothetical protein
MRFCDYTGVQESTFSVRTTAREQIVIVTAEVNRALGTRAADHATRARAPIARKRPPIGFTVPQARLIPCDVV